MPQQSTQFFHISDTTTNSATRDEDEEAKYGLREYRSDLRYRYMTVAGFALALIAACYAVSKIGYVYYSILDLVK